MTPKQDPGYGKSKALNSYQWWSNIKEFKTQSDILLHNMINTKIYSTSNRQLTSCCVLNCDNKQTKKPTNPP